MSPVWHWLVTEGLAANPPDRAEHPIGYHRWHVRNAGAAFKHWVELSRNFPSSYKGVPDNITDYAVCHGVIVG